MVQEQFGGLVVKSLNMETTKTVHVHLNDLKRYSRSSTSECKLKDAVKDKLCEDLELKFDGFIRGDFNVSLEKQGCSY